MENKNTIVAVVLMLAVWLGFTIFFPPQQAPDRADEQAPVTEPAAPAADSAAVPPDPVPAELPEPRTPTVDPGQARTITVETADYRAVFTTAGARLQEMVLKEYRESADVDAPPVSLLDAPGVDSASLGLSGTEQLGLSPLAGFRTDAPDVVRIERGEEREIRFVTQAPSGVTIEKIFVFGRDPFGIDLTVRLANPGSAPVRGKLDLSLVNPVKEEEGRQFTHVGPITLVGEDLETADIEDLDEAPQVFGANTVWSGFESKYFMSAAVPLEGAAETVRIDKSGALVVSALGSPVLTLQPGENQELDYFLYLGPRDLDILKTVDHQLARAIDFGFFSFLSRPLLHVLKFFHSYVNNYGIAIILLTVIIKLLFWPLTQKSYSSMKGMQKLQPEMTKIREKYKNDKERLNKEMMELYKTHRVNPLGGCLPMLVQIPVFFALYRVLMGSIELRHAEFALWLTDLSAKDPYYITPLIMGGTMFLQQKMTPSTMDPNQAKIFMFMPVIFTFLFLNFPSGLVIYWLVNNVLTIAQQYFINRKPA